MLVFEFEVGNILGSELLATEFLGRSVCSRRLFWSLCDSDPEVWESFFMGWV